MEIKTSDLLDRYLQISIGKTGCGIMVSEGDLLDRYSILMLRIEHEDEAAHNEIVLYDLEAKKLIQDERISTLYKELCDANRIIWELESNIRQNKTESLSLSDIGRTALEIRNINRRRITAKNAINAIFGRFLDNKVNHASEVSSSQKGR
jgi:hypothetical protein